MQTAFEFRNKSTYLHFFPLFICRYFWHVKLNKILEMQISGELYHGCFLKKEIWDVGWDFGKSPQLWAETEIDVVERFEINASWESLQLFTELHVQFYQFIEISYWGRKFYQTPTRLKIKCFKIGGRRKIWDFFQVMWATQIHLNETCKRLYSTKNRTHRLVKITHHVYWHPKSEVRINYYSKNLP